MSWRICAAEIEKDLGLVELTQALDEAEGAPAADDLVDSQPPLPLDDMVTHLPLVVELPEGLDADVRNLRAQLGRLGPVNLDALAEYNEVEARYNFLTTQAADLEHAVASLEEIIAELDQVMEREFLATFKAIAGKFKDEFSNLFGGGAAKLVLTDPESPNTTGIEIIARPPGKREQGLALLSGGERTLTAAALIFSILKTRPTPFCVLDEVDAALDEANVGRFRDALKALSAQTQFILITHNRGTIEVADTIYGVSMGADHTSTTLSLRLDGHELVPADMAEASWPLSRRLVSMLLALGTVILWGASFPLTKAALAYLGPTALAFLRWAISAVALIAWLAWKRRLPAALQMLRRNGRTAVWVALTGITFFYFLENLALRYTTATNAGVLSNFISVFMVLIGTVWLGERMTGVEWGAMAAAFVGAALVSQGAGHLRFAGAGLFGDLLMLVASFFGAVYSVGGKGLAARYPADVVITVVAALGALFCCRWR